MSGVMAAMAYSEATVENPTGIEVRTTDESLVAIQEPIGGTLDDGTVEIEDGVMNFNLGHSDAVDETGIQPGSEYVFEDLFRVRNNSSSDVWFTVDVDGFEDEVAKFIDIGTSSNHDTYVKDGEFGGGGPYGPEETYNQLDGGGNDYSGVVVTIDIPHPEDLDMDVDDLIEELHEGEIIVKGFDTANPDYSDD